MVLKTLDVSSPNFNNMTIRVLFVVLSALLVLGTCCQSFWFISRIIQDCKQRLGSHDVASLGKILMRSAKRYEQQFPVCLWMLFIVAILRACFEAWKPQNISYTERALFLVSIGYGFSMPLLKLGLVGLYQGICCVCTPFLSILNWQRHLYLQIGQGQLDSPRIDTVDGPAKNLLKWVIYFVLLGGILFLTFLVLARKIG